MSDRSVQEEKAKEITNYVKCLYDVTKKLEEVDHLDGGEALAELITDNFDDEQIWQQIELQNEARLTALVSDIALLVARKDHLCQPHQNDESPACSQNFEDSEEGEQEREEEEEEQAREGESGDDDDAEIDERLRRILREEQTRNNDLESDEDDIVGAFTEKKKKRKPVKVVPSEVDDKFFKLSEMENYLDLIEKGENLDDSDDSVDLLKSLSSEEESEVDEDDDESGGKKGLKYCDFFDAPIDEVEKSNTSSKKKQAEQFKKIEESGNDNDDEEEDEGEKEEENEDDTEAEGEDELRDIEEEEENTENSLRGGRKLLDVGNDSESSESDGEEKRREMKSSFEKRQERLKAKIKHLEEELLQEKPWQLKGEVSAKARPENALLEEDLEFDQMTREAPVITEKTSMRLEDIIKQRIKDKAWDDVERKVRPVETPSEFKKKLVMDQEKSKLSLAQIYEKEYLNKVAEATPNAEEKVEEVPKEHKEIKAMVDSLFRKLDALSNFHFTPKMVTPEVQIVTNVPAIQMEEVAPVSTSDATLLAPEEVKQKPRGDILGKEERTETDKKRERRQKKQRQRLHAREKEKREAAVTKLNPGLGNKYSKEKAIKDIERLSKDANIDLIDGSTNKRATKSSKAFFTQLQDEVKSQLKQKTLPAKRCKPANNMSAKRVKL